MRFDNHITIMPAANGFVVTLPDKSTQFDPMKNIQGVFDQLKDFKKDLDAGDDVLHDIMKKAKADEDAEKAKAIDRDHRTFIFKTFQEALAFLATEFQNV